MIEPFAAHIARDVVVVEGPDAETYLQGQLSQDVAAIAIGSWAWSLLLAPQGKIEAWLRVFRPTVERFELDVDTGFGDAVAARLGRFMIRTDAAISQSVRAMTAVRGVDLDPELGGAPILWPGVSGGDVIGDAPVGIGAGTMEQLERVRIEAGAPAMGSELDADVIPAEAGQWLVDASTSFTKGCYVGQELVARVDSRGSNTPRHLRIIEIDDGTVAVGAELVDPDGKVAGRLTSVSGDRGLSFIHRRTDETATLTITSDGHVTAARISPP